MSGERNNHEAVYRQAALHWAAAQHGSEGAALLQRHPDAAAREVPALSQTASRGALARWLWAELPMLEKAAGLRPPRTERNDPVTYWRRRYRLALQEEWQWLLARLPNLWRVLMDLQAGAVEQLALLLGQEMVARAARTLKPEQVGAFLEPVGQAYGRPIATRMVEIAPEDTLPEELMERWAQAFEEKARRGDPRKVLRWLAMTLLAGTMAARMSEPVRMAAVRHCRSDLFDVLSRSPRTRLVEPDHAERVEAMVLDVLGRLRAPGR